MISDEANKIVEEREAANQTVEVPDNVPEDSPASAYYSKEIWYEAKGRWDQLPAGEKAARKETRKKEFEELAQQFQSQLESQIRTQGFEESFSAWDLLWFGLAAFTAFRLGAGIVDED